MNWGGDGLRGADLAQPAQGLVGHVKDFGLYSEGSGAFAKGFEQVSDGVQ